jgi:hypothetical protein
MMLHDLIASIEAVDVTADVFPDVVLVVAALRIFILCESLSPCDFSSS